MAFRKRRTTRKITRRKGSRSYRKKTTKFRRRTGRRVVRRRRSAKSEWKYFRGSIGKRHTAAITTAGPVTFIKDPVSVATLAYPGIGLLSYQRVGAQISRMGLSVSGTISLNPFVTAGNGTGGIVPVAIPTQAYVRIIWYQVKSASIYPQSGGNVFESPFANGIDAHPAANVDRSGASSGFQMLFATPNATTTQKLYADVPNTSYQIISNQGATDEYVLPHPEVQALVYGPLRAGCSDYVRILDSTVISLNSNSVAMKKYKRRFSPHRYKWVENVEYTADSANGYYLHPVNPIMMHALVVFNMYAKESANVFGYSELAGVSLNLTTQLYYQDA